MKYRVLIIEDEPLERRLLLELVGQMSGEVETAAVSNGLDALACLEKWEADVLLVDIQIPGISGLELLDILDERRFPGEILITTANHTFSCARQAMRCRAAGYLLKPVMEEELWEYLGKCFERVRERREEEQRQKELSSGIESARFYAQQYLVQDFLQGRVREKTFSRVYGWAKDRELQAGLACVWLREMTPEKQQKEALRICQESLSPHFLCLWMYEGQRLLLLLHSQKREPEGFLRLFLYFLGDSLKRQAAERGLDIKAAVSPLCESYRALEEEAKGLWYRAPGKEEAGKRRPLGLQELCSERECQRRRQKALQRLQDGEMKRIFGLFSPYFMSENAMHIWTGVYHLMEVFAAFDPSFDPFSFLTEMDLERPKDAVGEKLAEYCAAERKKERDGQRAAIRSALEQMEAGYFSADFSQAFVAEYLGLDTAYFSRLFKRETGETFMAALTRLRMEHAREYLKAGMKPEQVAKACGYRNRKYFCEAFKRYTGRSIYECF